MKIPASIPSVLFVLTVASSRGQSPGYYPSDIDAARLSIDPTRGYPGSGGPPRPDILGKNRSQALQQAIGLTNEQTFKIERILTQETADCQAMGAAALAVGGTGSAWRARDEIRALLTPLQRAKFNLVPESHGGGLFGPSPWEQLARLDKLIHLAPEQKQPVLEALIDRTENLMENHGPEKSDEAG